MKICCIYIAWFDGIEILPFSIAAIEDLVDEVIIIYSNTSNYGHTVDYVDQIEGLGTLINWEPHLDRTPAMNELDKRNFGLQAARSLGYSHFVMLDCDECYDPLNFKYSRDLFTKYDDLNGLVCGLKVYIREPTLMCRDHTLVPFIHRFTPGLKFTFANKTYPFAYDKFGHAHIDPTRRLNITGGGVAMAYPTTMHHFSHVRRDIKLKMANSTASGNLTKSTLLEDYENAAPGYYSKFYRDVMKVVPNRFKIKI